jgi:hypothetical protein
MEEALELGSYLPISYRTSSEEEYISFLWDAFNTNYTHGKYQFAFLAYHMLTLSFVYFNVWQIKQAQPNSFAYGAIGFSKDIEKGLLTATSPFDYSAVNESSILRFLKLISCDNDKIGNYTKLVKDRNDSAHSNGHIYFNSVETLDAKVAQILRAVEEIQSHSRPVIEHIYIDFLRQSYDPEVRENVDAGDQIREVLIHGNYLSRKDIEICASCSLDTLRTHERFADVEALHNDLRAYCERLE